MNYAFVCFIFLVSLPYLVDKTILFDKGYKLFHDHIFFNRDIWMQKLAESLTDVFQSNYTCQYYRMGWCYIKVELFLNFH